jgi:hypothetical protein
MEISRCHSLRATPFCLHICLANQLVHHSSFMIPRSVNNAIGNQPVATTLAIHHQQITNIKEFQLHLPHLFSPSLSTPHSTQVYSHAAAPSAGLT